MTKELELFKRWFGVDLTPYQDLNINIDVKKNLLTKEYILTLIIDYGHTIDITKRGHTTIDITKRAHALVKFLECEITDLEYLWHYPHNAGMGGEDFSPYYEICLILSPIHQKEWEQYEGEERNG